MKSIELLLFIASLGFSGFLFLSLLKGEKKFFLALFMFKPFIDQTVRFEILNVGGSAVTLLSIWGVITFVVVVVIYFSRVVNAKKRVYAQGLIWSLLFIHLLSSSLSLSKGQISFMNLFEMFLKISTPYFIYFIFILNASDSEFMRSLFRAIWLGNLYAVLFTILLHRVDIGFMDLSQNVVRFTGFFADSATLSLAAFSALVFAILYKEWSGLATGIFERNLYYLTWIGFAYIFWITLTKATILITIALFLLWYGYYKRKKILVFPMMLFGILFFFKESQSAQYRFSNEIRFVQTIGKERLDLDRIRGVGSGRVGRWVDTIKIYNDEYTFTEKLIGTYLFHKSHNQFIGFLMQIGLIGLLVFLWVTLWLFRGMLVVYSKSRSPVIFMGIIMLTSMLLYGIGYQSFTYTGTLWMAFMLISPINIAHRSRRGANSLAAPA